jgi:uncharacterized protein
VCRALPADVPKEESDVEDPPARDRHGVEVLTSSACIRLLEARSVGRIAFVSAGTPVIVPVNYALDGSSVVFRSRSGAKLDAAERHQPIAFEVDDHEPASRSGWSVLVTGVAEPVDDPELIERLERQQLESWAMADTSDATWVRLRTDTVSGRRVRAATSS